MYYLQEIVSSLEEVKNEMQRLKDNDRKQLALIQNGILFGCFLELIILVQALPGMTK